jgi:hypothetical protein
MRIESRIGVRPEGTLRRFPRLVGGLGGHPLPVNTVLTPWGPKDNMVECGTTFYPGTTFHPGNSFAANTAQASPSFPSLTSSIPADVLGPFMTPSWRDSLARITWDSPDSYVLIPPLSPQTPTKSQPKQVQTPIAHCPICQPSPTAFQVPRATLSSRARKDYPVR